jgi:hypothetical protein
MMKTLGLGVAVALALLTPSRAQQGVAPNPDLLVACNQSVFYDASTSGQTRLIVGVANKSIYVCGFNFWSAGTVNVELLYGTGGACQSFTQMTPNFQFTAQTGIVDHPVVYQGLRSAPPSNDVCIDTSAGVAVQAIVYYSQW